jgi:hypothetical protein
VKQVIERKTNTWRLIIAGAESLVQGFPVTIVVQKAIFAKKVL